MSKIAILEHLKACSRAAKKFTSDLVGEVTEAIAEAMLELESVKADKPAALSVTIPASGWSDADGTSYPKYYDISVTGITEKDRAEITIAPGSLDAALSCGLCPTNQTLAGKIRVWASGIPEGDILVECWIENGK